MYISKYEFWRQRTCDVEGKISSTRDWSFTESICTIFPKRFCTKTSIEYEGGYKSYPENTPKHFKLRTSALGQSGIQIESSHRKDRGQTPGKHIRPAILPPPFYARLGSLTKPSNFDFTLMGLMNSSSNERNPSSMQLCIRSILPGSLV